LVDSAFAILEPYPFRNSAFNNLYNYSYTITK